jgi:hypothetical protein
MRPTRTLLAFLAMLAAGLGALALAGSRPHQVRAFSLDVPYLQGVATLRMGQSACESPIVTPAAFGGVRIWAGTIGAPGATGALEVIVSDAADGQTLARGGVLVPPPRNSVSATLDAEVPADRAVALCLVGAGTAPVIVAGSAPVDPSVRLRVGGRPSRHQFSLVALAQRPRSLLSMVPTIFKRAGLFRPGWVGTWTFWALAVALLAAAALLGGAVVAVARSEDAAAQSSSASTSRQ